MSSRKDTLGGLLIIAVMVAAVGVVACAQTSKLPPRPPVNDNGVKVDFVSRNLRFGIVAIEGHHYAFGLGLVHAESCPCKIAPPPRDDQTLPDGAFIPLGPTQKPAEDEGGEGQK